MEKIKILFVIESLELGGAEKSLVTLLQNLDYSKYNISLLLIKKEGVFNKFVPKEVSIVYYDIFKNTSFIKKYISRITFFFQRMINTKYNTAHLFWKSFGKNIPTFTKKYNIAIAYSQGFSTYFTSEKIKADKKYTWINTDYKKAKHNADFDLKYYNKYNKIIAVSNDAKKKIQNAYKKLNLVPKISIIKDISDKKNIIKKAKNQVNVFSNGQNTINILTTGRLVKPKGYSMAIDACYLLLSKDYNIQWYAIGEGNHRKTIEKQIKFRGLQSNFHLLGYKENPYPYINECDIYVQPSLFEGLGLTVIEATILNKPVVCTNFSTASSIIKHNETGLICEMSSEAIANSIEQYIINPELVKKVTQNLQKAVNKDKEVSLRKINDLLS